MNYLLITLSIHPSHWAGLRRVSTKIAVLALLLVGVGLAPSLPGLSGVAGYEPLHTLLEMVSILVSGLIFAVVWHAPPRRLALNMTVLACVFVGVALLDFSHLLSIQGMPHYVTPSSSEKAIDFWLAARLLAAAGLLFIAMKDAQTVDARPVRYGLLGSVLALVAVTHWLFLLHPELLPRTYVQGTGLTAFKKNAEYGLIGLNIAAILALLWRMRGPLSFDGAYLLGALACMAMSEFFLTLYSEVTDIYLVIGHIYKIFSYLFLYQMVFVETTSRPYRELKESQRQLQRSETFARTIAENVPGMLGYWDTELRCTFANQAYQAWFGRTATEMNGVSMQELMGEALFQKNEPFVRAALAGVDQKFERTLVKPDGEVGYTWAQYIVQWQNGKVIGFLALVTDITEIKKIQQSLQLSLHEREALLKEVHHRVKNNLQVVTSLLRLESRRSDLPATKAALKAMQERIRSMALLHESIYREGTFASIELGDYLRQLATQTFSALLAAPGTIHLCLELGAVQLGLDQALPCGLLISELLTNALKHGFPDGRMGEVCLELQSLDNDADWRLRVSDNGVGLPHDWVTKRQNSLGLQLVSNLASQCGGTLKIGPGPVFTVDFRVVPPAHLQMPAT